VEQIRLALPLVDVVLIMSVTPGFGGQVFIEDTLEKARDLTRFRAVDGLGYLIEIDGGLNLSNAGSAAAAGCDAIVAGSAVFGASDPADYLIKLKEAFSNARFR
jgi:ribulose-phosphate 3-epimerase